MYFHLTTILFQKVIEKVDFRKRRPLVELEAQYRPIVPEDQVMPESLFKLNTHSYTVTVHWANVRQAQVVLNQLRATLADLNGLLTEGKRRLIERARRTPKPAVVYMGKHEPAMRIFPFSPSRRAALFGAKRIDELLRKRNALKLNIEHEIRLIEQWLLQNSGEA